MKIYLFSALLYFGCLYKIFAHNTSYQGNNFWLTYGAQYCGYSFSQLSSPYAANYSPAEFSELSTNLLDDARQGNPLHFSNGNVLEVKNYTSLSFEKPFINRPIREIPDPNSNASSANLINSVDFDLPQYCLQDGTAVFVNKTIYTGTGTLTYLWNFGDFLAPPQFPNTSTQKDGVHSYTEVGVYEVTLTVTSSDGYTATVSKQFRVDGPPTAEFDVINQGKLCSSNNVEFRDKATVAFGEINKIEWYFDFQNSPTPDVVDLAPLKRNALSKVYTFKYATFTDVPSKSYVVKMKAYSGSACVSEAVKTITIYANPEVDFLLESSCMEGGVAKFNNLSTYAAPNENLTYRWEFGDANATAENPNFSDLKNPTHQYTKIGKYTVKLTIVTPNSCEKSISKEITIDGAKPDAEFKVLNELPLCSQTPIAFEAKTGIAFGKITKVEWYFDYENNPGQVQVDNDPTSGNGVKIYNHQYPSFNFPFSQTYLVKMMVYSEQNCVATVEDRVTVNAVPDLRFEDIGPVCSSNLPIQLVAYEKNNRPGVGEFSGKGVNKDGLFDPTIAGAGIHAVKYTFVPENGCSKELSWAVVVNQSPGVDLGNDIIMSLGTKTKLKPIVTGGENLTYRWTPNIGLDRNDILEPVASPTTDVIYTLTVINEFGCEQSDQISVKVVRVPEIPSVITPNGDFINDVWNIKYLEYFQSVEVRVFDRNGMLVFASKGYQKPFDGTYNGVLLPIGVYYYVINLFGYGKPLTGALTIVR